MKWFTMFTLKKNANPPLINTYVKFRSSIYGRVVFIILISSLFLFFSFGLIFRSVNESYMNSVIRENGNNIGYLVESALYRAMLENDQTSLQNTLYTINNMTGIDHVNMYDARNNLVYTSITNDDTNHSDPDCISCHQDFGTMFAEKEKSYKIIDVDSECSMNHLNNEYRHLVIKSPILNSKSCYTAECHAHTVEEEVLGSLIIKMPMKSLDDALAKSNSNFFIFAAAMTLILVAYLIFFTANNIKAPLNAIITASEAVAQGDRSTRLEINSKLPSDMRMVSIALNDMLDNLQAANNELHNWSQQLEYKVQKKSEELSQVQNELLNIERIASLGRLSLSVAHEINNPLSGILVYSKLLQKQLGSQNLDPEKRESILKHLSFIESETKRCGDIVKGLLDFSRKDQDGFEPRHLHEILNDTFELMLHPMKMANISFMTDFTARLDMIYCSPNQIKQACVALLVNASEAITQNGEVIMSTANPDEQHIRIDFTDNGIGISEASLPHIFEPFFSTKEKTSGIGLGLSITHGIIKSHNGKISVRSEKGKGTTVSITLPLHKT